jgi:hypothetical protein
VDPVRLATCLDRSVAASGAIASTVTPCLPWRKLLSGEVGWNGISAACRLGPFGAAVVPPPSPGGPTLRQWQIEAEVVEFDADRNSGAQARLDRPVDKRRAPHPLPLPRLQIQGPSRARFAPWMVVAGARPIQFVFAVPSGTPALRRPSRMRACCALKVGSSDGPHPAIFCTVKAGSTLRSSATASFAPLS